MAPEVPDYVLDALDARAPAELRQIAAYAEELAEYKEAQMEREVEKRREEEGIDPEQKEELEEQGVSTDPDDYDGVPGNAYITTKEPHEGKKYYYWQWREGPNSWGNEYIGPVGGGE